MRRAIEAKLVGSRVKKRGMISPREASVLKTGEAFILDADIEERQFTSSCIAPGSQSVDNIKSVA